MLELIHRMMLMMHVKWEELLVDIKMYKKV